MHGLWVVSVSAHSILKHETHFVLTFCMTMDRRHFVIAHGLIMALLYTFTALIHHPNADLSSGMAFF